MITNLRNILSHKTVHCFTFEDITSFIFSSYSVTVNGSCLKTGQHSIFVIIYLLLPIKDKSFDSV